MTKVAPRGGDIFIPPSQISPAKSSGPLNILPAEGMQHTFFTVTESGGTFHTSDFFTTGDIETIAPDLRILYSPNQQTLVDEDDDLAAELAELLEAGARFDESPLPEGFDFTGILEP
jgi:hypothetical protein